MMERIKTEQGIRVSYRTDNDNRYIFRNSIGIGDIFSAVYRYRYRYRNTFLGLYRPIQRKPGLSLHFWKRVKKIAVN